jgi:hypothetical protein
MSKKYVFKYKIISKMKIFLPLMVMVVVIYIFTI